LNIFLNWFDNHRVRVRSSNTIDWLRVVPFVLLHAGCFLVVFVGVSSTAIMVAVSLFWLRIFAIGAFYHRYFAHKTFKTHRVWQFVFALLGGLSAQRGPIWWAAHHREHHLSSDTEDDPHSPWTQSFLRSHMGWFLTHKHFHTNTARVKDWLRFPELRWLDRFDVIVPLSLLLILWVMGQWLASAYPELHTSGFQLVVWGFCLSTVASLHVTLSINSLGHLFGTRRYATKDQSRNNWFLALLTLGEGWHNNHHHYPATARQGFAWWEIDITFYLLCLLEKLGIIYDLKKVSKPIVR